jgi:cell division protein FtsQ
MSSGPLLGRRWAPLLTRPRLPSRRRLGILALLLVVLAGGWLWVRQSSLVAIRHVTVVGVSGADAGAVRAALIDSAERMTTLDVSVGSLRRAVASYPDVAQVSASTQFPHGLVIRVDQNVPVAVARIAGRPVVVAGNGTLLSGAAGVGRLPQLPISVAPLGERVTDRTALRELAVLTAAPYQFLPQIAEVTWQTAHGVVVALRNGPSVYFGSATRLGAKWRAAVAVLADTGSDGALYVDVTDPQRPAAGGGSAAAALAASEQAASASATAASATGTTTSAATGTGTAPTATTTAPAATTTAPVATTTAPAATTTAPANTGTSTTG